MYKAEVDVVGDEHARKLRIRADYGKDEPINIPFSDMTEVERLVAITHAKGLFMRSQPRLTPVLDAALFDSPERRWWREGKPLPQDVRNTLLPDAPIKRSVKVVKQRPGGRR